MKFELPSRKVIRLKEYDYRQNGYYFITICTHNKSHFFGKIVDNEMVLNQIGTIAFNVMGSIENHHRNVKVLNFVVMPNHVHLILGIDKTDNVYEESEYNSFSKALRGSISTIIGSYKSAVSKGVHLLDSTDSTGDVPTVVWQSRFYEHVIRDEDDYYRIWQYIDENPQKWNDDCYY